mmetsp:Transcript_26914/g.80496  ORF Transcript_26914/g.80496 Transcript_26914/m.80496 type:complete len:335 (-) Transcript_26914:59-1063(-)
MVDGWTVKLCVRPEGGKVTGDYFLYYSDDGRQFRSRAEIARYFRLSAQEAYKMARQMATTSRTKAANEQRQAALLLRARELRGAGGTAPKRRREGYAYADAAAAAESPQLSARQAAAAFGAALCPSVEWRLDDTARRSAPPAQWASCSELSRLPTADALDGSHVCGTLERALEALARVGNEAARVALDEAELPSAGHPGTTKRSSERDESSGLSARSAVSLPSLLGRCSSRGAAASGICGTDGCTLPDGHTGLCQVPDRNRGTRSRRCPSRLADQASARSPHAGPPPSPTVGGIVKGDRAAREPKECSQEWMRVTAGYVYAPCANRGGEWGLGW